MMDNPFKDSEPLPAIDPTLSMVMDVELSDTGIRLRLQSPDKDLDGNPVPTQNYSYAVTRDARITTDMHRGNLSPSDLYDWFKATASERVRIDVRLTWDMEDPLQLVKTARFVHYGI